MAVTHDHGHTPAAWTGVIISFAGFLIAGGFTVAAIPAGFWAGIGLILLGPVVGGTMKLMGLGAEEPGYVKSARQDATKAEQEDPRTPANV